MNEPVLNSLMLLFAIFTYIKEDTPEDAGRFVNEFLSERLNTDLAQKFFNRYLAEVEALKKEYEKRRKKASVLSVKILTITEQINNTLDQKEKYLVLIRTIEYVISKGEVSDEVLDIIKTLADAINIPENDFWNIFYFTQKKFHKIKDKENLLIINSKNIDLNLKGVKFIENKEIDKPIYLLFIPSLSLFFLIYTGEKDLRINSRRLKKDTAYLFDNGGVISKLKESFIYQNELLKNFLQTTEKEHITLTCEKIEFKYKKSENGLHRVSFQLTSGQLIGVMGSSGVGKSTFLNILAGKLPLNSGKILINGYDLHKDNEKLKGLIGFVPQDDLLIEELTVFENLYFSAKLSLGTYTDQQIREKVNKTLKELNLYDIRNHKVGTILNRNISGGQRKRLNIALELIREPFILFVDEPTSGLSSTDAEAIMHLLKHLSLTGKLVIVNIHQPSSEIYKLFNQVIILDKGGYVTYIGDPIKAIWYFKILANYPDAQYVVCPTCGSVKPEEVLEIIEEKIIIETGHITDQRKVLPRTWYLLFKANFERLSKIKKDQKQPLPKTDFKTPSLFRQFLIFIKRNVLAKVSDKQFVIISVLEAPLLAFILALFSKKILPSGEYIFMKNNNIPVFLFMSVVVAMFLGLSISAEEIIKDRKILERERFLNLSRLSYLFSKFFTLLIISAFQMFVYVLISNSILGIKDMFWEYWFILFSTAVVSNLIGLNISSAFKSVVSIYILIPLILVPQMLLGGAMMRFDDIHPLFSSKKYTPVIADLTIARWAFEALSVVQFADNKYEKNFFEYDKKRSLALYITGFWTTEMQKIAKQTLELKQQNKKYQFYNNIQLIKNEFERLKEINFIENLNLDLFDHIDLENFNERELTKLTNLLEYVKEAYKEALQIVSDMKDKKIQQIIDSNGIEYLVSLKKNYLNEKLEDIVLERGVMKMIIRDKDYLIRKRDPIFTRPYSNCLRAHFYAYEKYICGKPVKTFVFNNAVLWFYTVILFIALYFDLLKKLIELLERTNSKNNKL